MDADQISDDEYDYEYEDDEDFDDDNMAAADSGGGAAGGGGAGSGKGGGGGGGGASSAAEAEVDLALRDETGVAFVDQAQLKVLMSKVVSDIRYAASSSHGKRYYAVLLKFGTSYPCSRVTPGRASHAAPLAHGQREQTIYSGACLTRHRRCTLQLT